MADDLHELDEQVPLLDENIYDSLSPDLQEIVDCVNKCGDSDECPESVPSVGSSGSIESECDNYEFQISYRKFPQRIVKKQRRLKNPCTLKQGSQQRIPPEDGQIKLVLHFANSTITNRIKHVCLYVERTEKNIPNSKELFFGSVQLDKVDQYKELALTNEYIVSANLDDVYKVDGKEVYKLAKTGKKEHNLFQVVIRVIFQNGIRCEAITKPFQVVGRDDGKQFTMPEPPRKRPHNVLEVEESFDGIDSPPPFYELKECSAWTGKFCHLYVGKLIKTSNGDIAYHFRISDPNVHDNFEPGEIIGFFRDKLGKTVIQKLCNDNISSAYMKGVVTESQYLEANKPEDEKIKTVTICMLGLVNVKVYGQVNISDHLYASKEHPGAAVSAHNHYARYQDKQSYIGQSLEATRFRKDSEARNVKALVSLFGAAANDLMKKEFDELERSVEVGTREVGKKSKRLIMIASIITAILVILLLILFWQLFVPGSAFKRMRCLHGSVGEDHYAVYWKWAEGKRYKGVEFECKGLWKKIAHRLYKHEHERAIQHFTYQCPDKDFKYFLNIDTCSGVGTAPIIFAVDKNCSHVYTFNENQGVWNLQKQVCADRKCNMDCDWRHYPHGTCTDKAYGTDCPRYSSSFDNFTRLNWNR